MKIINLGILAHVDAGKTTLTESLLYTSGAIAELGSVDEGTTRTDTMNLERQRGITIQTAVTSFQWEDVKVNIIDTPGHMDFLAEVYRSLAVLDGAILVISAKDGVQAQTRILFHALRKMNIPTVIFINKIDQAGVDLQSVVQSVRDKLSADIIIKQTVSLSPEIVLEENTDIEAWDAVIENNDKLLEKVYRRRTNQPGKNLCGRNSGGFKTPVPRSIAAAPKGPWHSTVDGCGDRGCSNRLGNRSAAPMRQRFQGGVYRLRPAACLSTAIQRNAAPADTVALAGRKAENHEMRIPSKGEIVRTDTAYPGEIVILADDTLKLNDILGNEKLLPHKTRIDNPMPLLRTTVEPQKPEQREALLNALAEIADTDPLLHFDIDTVTHEIMLSFLGKVQLEVICSLLEEKYHVGVAMKEPSVIYLERPLRKAEYTIHIEVPLNPFWASVRVVHRAAPYWKRSAV